MLVELENHYKSLQDKKSESRRRTLLLLLPLVAFLLVGYSLNNSNSAFAYLVGALIAFIFLVQIVSPLARGEIAFEKVYKAMGLIPRQGNASTKRKLRRLLKGTASLPVRVDDPLLRGGIEPRRKMNELIKRRLLPAASAGRVKETTLESLALLFMTPSVSAVSEFNDQLLKGYDDVEEVTFKVLISRFRGNRIGLFIEPLAKALVLGFVVAVGIAYLWVDAWNHQDLSTYLNTNPNFATAIFSFAGILTVAFLTQFRRK